MPATYELWLLDDAGRRVTLLQNLAYFSYSRSLLGYGTILVGLPYEELRAKVNPVFLPDRMIDVWRSPAEGFPLRRECTYFARLNKIYTRETDNMRMISFTGHDPTDLLARRFVVQAGGSSYTRKTNFVDDMMKAIVREQMLWDSSVDEEGVQDNDRAYPEGSFTVQENGSLGPSVTAGFSDRNVLDVLKELKQTSFQLNQDDPVNRKIYFDVVPYDVTPVVTYILDEVTGDPMLDENGSDFWDESSTTFQPSVGFQFQTFADLRGLDRRNAIEFSAENSNLQSPYYTQDFLDEVNAVIVKGFGRGESRVSAWVEDTLRIKASRWNRREAFQDGSQEPEQAKLVNIGYPALYDGFPKEEISAVFLNVPGGPENPRSLYGIDWDLGDLVHISYAGKHFETEIVIVYVAVDENGKETVTGRNKVAAASG